MINKVFVYAFDGMYKIREVRNLREDEATDLVLEAIARDIVENNPAIIQSVYGGTCHHCCCLGTQATLSQRYRAITRARCRNHFFRAEITFWTYQNYHIIATPVTLGQ